MERRQPNVPALDAFDPLLFERNENDQITLKHGGALFVSEDSGLRIRTDGSSLVERNASPVALQAVVKPADLRNVDTRLETQSSTDARLSSALATKAPLSHTHTDADIVPGTIKLTPHASGVNGVEIQEAPSLFGPNITPYGTDANIRLTIFGKGTEKVYVNGALPMLGGQTLLAMSTAVLVGGTVTVALASVAANCIIATGHQTFGGVPGLLSWTISAGVDFTITSASAVDTSTVWYMVFLP